MRQYLLPVSAIVFLTACGSSGPTGAELPDRTATPPAGAVVPTDGFETYVTQHNGFTRIRRSDDQAGDAAILAQFEDADPASPAGFRSLVDYRTTAVGGRVDAEIIVETGVADTIERILRLTTDVEPFTPERVAAAGGEIVLSGSDYSLVRINDFSYQFANQSDPGALYLALNFDTQTAAIRIINRDFYQHTPQSELQELNRVDLLGENLPFNTETGAFGGEINGEVYRLAVRLGSYTIPVSGTVLGQLGGSEPDNLVAGGVFEASGSGIALGQQTDVRVDGVFHASN
ncbi:MAG: hypothetical protein JJU19_06010 [Pararhodobacter sp.]|nr:hypothetical protein [Pararhodobacter sp.]